MKKERGDVQICFNRNQKEALTTEPPATSKGCFLEAGVAHQDRPSCWPQVLWYNGFKWV